MFLLNQFLVSEWLQTKYPHSKLLNRQTKEKRKLQIIIKKTLNTTNVTHNNTSKVSLFSFSFLHFFFVKANDFDYIVFPEWFWILNAQQWYNGETLGQSQTSSHILNGEDPFETWHPFIPSPSFSSDESMAKIKLYIALIFWCYTSSHVTAAWRTRRPC